MKENLAKGGAIASALGYLFCWQLPLILASLGLGSSFTMSIWFARFRWIFLAVTIVLLGFAYYQSYKGRHPGGPWSRRILHTTAILSVGILTYTLVFNY